MCAWLNFVNSRSAKVCVVGVPVMSAKKPLILSAPDLDQEDMNCYYLHFAVLIKAILRTDSVL